MHLRWIVPLWEKESPEFTERNFWEQEFPLNYSKYADKENIFVTGMFQSGFRIYFSTNISYFMKYVKDRIALFGWMFVLLKLLLKDFSSGFSNETEMYFV